MGYNERMKEFFALQQRVDKLLLRLETVRLENRTIRDKHAVLQSENQQLREQMELARLRLESLLKNVS